MNDSSGPAAVATAASKGIGAACAREPARRGYRLTIMARSDSIRDVAAEIGTEAVRGDVTEAGDLVRLVDRAMAAHGRIDAAVVGTGMSRDPGDGGSFDIHREASVVDHDDLY